MAQNMPRGLVCTIITNSLAIAEELRKYGMITIYVTGGETSSNGTFYDIFTLDFIQCFRFDLCFITSTCISADFGLSIQQMKNVGLINLVLDGSRTKYGLYPAKKVGLESIVSICPANRLDALITDWDISEDDVAALEEQNIEVIVVDKPE